MLNADSLSEARVVAASAASVLKSGMTTAAMMLMLVALLIALWRSQRVARAARFG
jgi:hypothetical protein